VHLPHRSRLKWMFWHDQLLRLFWDDKWGKTVTGVWSAAWGEWIAIGFLWLLAWRHAIHIHHLHHHHVFKPL